MDHQLIHQGLEWILNNANLSWVLAGLLGLSEWFGSSSSTKVKSLSSLVMKVFRAVKAVEVLEQTQAAGKASEKTNLPE